MKQQRPAATPRTARVTSLGGRLRRRTPPGVLLVAGIIVVAVVAGLALAMTGGENPHYQQRVSMPGMGDHLVNLWVSPRPPQAGQVELTAQVTDVGGWPSPPGSLSFTVLQPGGAGVHSVMGQFHEEGPGRGMVYRGTLDFQGAGPWLVTVRFPMDGQEGMAQFAVTAER